MEEPVRPPAMREIASPRLQTPAHWQVPHDLCSSIRIPTVPYLVTLRQPQGHRPTHNIRHRDDVRIHTRPQ